MTSERIKEIQETTGLPQSTSVYLALLQVWNECAQEAIKEQSVLECIVKKNLNKQ